MRGIGKTPNYEYIVENNASTSKRPVKGSPAGVEQGGHFLAALAVLDQRPGMIDLLRE
jgi:hypothetical protein